MYLIISDHIVYHIISYHIISYHITFELFMFQESSHSLEEQPQTSNGVPVLVEKCVDFIYINGTLLTLYTSLSSVWLGVGRRLLRKLNYCWVEFYDWKVGFKLAMTLNWSSMKLMFSPFPQIKVSNAYLDALIYFTPNECRWDSSVVERWAASCENLGSNKIKSRRVPVVCAPRAYPSSKTNQTRLTMRWSLDTGPLAHVAAC